MRPTGTKQNKITYDFRLGEQQKLNLKRQLISLYMITDDLFYKIRPMSAVDGS